MFYSNFFLYISSTDDTFSVTWNITCLILPLICIHKSFVHSKCVLFILLFKWFNFDRSFLSLCVWWWNTYIKLCIISIKWHPLNLLSLCSSPSVPLFNTVNRHFDNVILFSIWLGEIWYLKYSIMCKKYFHSFNGYLELTLKNFRSGNFLS